MVFLLGQIYYFLLNPFSDCSLLRNSAIIWRIRYHFVKLMLLLEKLELNKDLEKPTFCIL
jgi:hypothetical protein